MLLGYAPGLFHLLSGRDGGLMNAAVTAPRQSCWDRGLLVSLRCWLVSVPFTMLVGAALCPAVIQQCRRSPQQL
jgi:hypothetical protein